MNSLQLLGEQYSAMIKTESADTIESRESVTARLGPARVQELERIAANYGNEAARKLFNYKKVGHISNSSSAMERAELSKFIAQAKSTNSLELLGYSSNKHDHEEFVDHAKQELWIRDAWMDD